MHASEQFELIQYAPATPEVHRIPLLIVPPMINKFYVIDLAPGRSMAEYLVGQGHQVFVLSWRNPDARHRDWNLDSYGGAIVAGLDAIREITGAPQASVLALCSGGIAAAMVAAHLSVAGRLGELASLALGVAVLDQSQAGTAGAIIDEPAAAAAIAVSATRGYLDGRNLAEVFAWLRPDDLIWNYWVNNYLQGKPPPAFDILAWNTDTTRLPAALHRDFISLALANALTKPDAATMLGSPVDLSKVDTDAYVIAAAADHLCPWQSCYRTTQLLGGPVTFVLSTSGHIAAMVNPPDNPKAAFQALPDRARWSGARVARCRARAGPSGAGPPVRLDPARVPGRRADRAGQLVDGLLGLAGPPQRRPRQAPDQLGSPSHPVSAPPRGPMSTTAELRTVAVGGRLLRVSVRPGRGEPGSPARPPLLLFNGIGASLELLEPFVARLDPAVEVIRFDPPGVGGSPLPPNPYRFSGLCRLIADLLTELGHDQVDVLGISWGGAVAQHFAAFQRDRCRRLVLVATATGAVMVPARPSVLAHMVTPRRYLNRGYLERVAGTIYGGTARGDPSQDRGGHARRPPDRAAARLLVPARGQQRLDQPAVPALAADSPRSSWPETTTRSSRWPTPGS